MSTLIENKKAQLRFTSVDMFQAGIELAGHEVKAVRNKLGSMEGSRVVVRGGEAFLIGMTIPPYQIANTPADYDPERSRRLLLSKKEIAELADAEIKKGLTVVPFELYNAGRYLKVRVAIVKNKGKADRREEIKKRTDERETARELKRKI